jgi:hypothetical protein
MTSFAIVAETLPVVLGLSKVGKFKQSIGVSGK